MVDKNIVLHQLIKICEMYSNTVKVEKRKFSFNNYFS